MSKRFKIGIDLGATRIKMALVDKKARISYRRELDTPFKSRREEVIDILISNVRELIMDAQFGKGDIVGIGIGVPGPVDSKRGIVRYFPNMEGWERVPLKELLHKKLGFIVELDNDVNAMALAESKFGAGKGVDNLVCLTLGTGVGGGIIIGGQLYRGGTMCAGEIGHIPINEIGPLCNCGGMACLERYIGNRYILNMASKIFGRPVPLEELTTLGKSGNRNALKIWEDIGKKLGVALTGVVNLLNPDIVVIGGGVSKAGELLLEPLRREIRARAMRDQARHVKIVSTELGDNAGIIGASLLV